MNVGNFAEGPLDEFSNLLVTCVICWLSSINEGITKLFFNFITSGH